MQLARPGAAIACNSQAMAIAGPLVSGCSRRRRRARAMQTRLPMDVIEIRTSSDRDPDGRHFRALVQAIDQVNRLAHLRRFAVNALAALAGFLWLSLILPRIVPALVRDLAVLAYAAMALGAVAAMALEARWARIHRRCMQAADARVLGAEMSAGS